MATVEAQGNSAAYQQFAELLRKLHRVMSEGGGDSPEADAIRDEMDGPWYALSEEEQRRARGLSADLYTLEPESPIVHPKESGIFVSDLAEKIRAARDVRNFDRVLELLRDNPEKISADRAGMLRALCYEQLGDVESSVLFLQGAVEVSKDDSYAVFLLLKLLEQKRLDLALDWASRLTQGEKPHSGQLWLIIGHVYFDAAQIEEPGEDRNSQLQHAADAYEEAANVRSTENPTAAELLLAVNALLGRALTSNLLGRDGDAIAVLDEALALDAKDETVLTIRALLTLKADWDKAMQFFARAVENGATSIWPYYYLAFEAFQNNEFENCLKFASSALRHNSDRATRADLYEWMAISLAETGSVAGSVLSCFNAAAANAPENERIADNRQIYEEFLRSPGENRSQWRQMDASERPIPTQALISTAEQRLGLAAATT
jgi:tetratricopeptide (TPR) repeat protein